MNEMKLLTPLDYLPLRKYFINLRYDLSIYSLPSLISWNNDIHSSFYAIIDELLVIVTESKERESNNPYLILPLSAVEREPTVQELYDLANELGCREYRYIPEGYLARRDLTDVARLFTVTEQDEYTDYIYKTLDLATLAGRRYAKKRNHLSQFLRAYADNGLVKIEPITSDNKQECLAFMDKWCDEYPCDGPDKEDLSCEHKAITVSLENMELFELCGQAVRIDDIISAFGITARLNDRMGILHFEKAFASIHGLYQFLDRECARTCLGTYEFCNKESDMGLPGLEQSKKSYYPCARVKSYRMTLI